MRFISEIIFKLILNEVNNKNPKGHFADTPLHFAAERGHLEICKLIGENATAKNPTNNSGKTPLDLANAEKLCCL